MKLKFNVGLGALLTVLFVGLKLTNFISWSWLWVLCPLWLGFATSALVWFIFFVLAGLAVFFGTR